MIRLVGKKLIIPRGDTGSFSVPLVTTFNPSDAAVFSIIDEKTQTVVKRIECSINQEALTVNFTHDETVNLPVGKYYWDIKSYKNPEIVDGELVNGTEVDSYYAAYSLPVCEIRQTGDNLLVADESPNTTLTSQSINMLQAVTNEVVNAKTRAQTAATNAENNATIVEDALSQITQLGAEAITLQSDENATASYDKDTGLLTIGVPKGAVPNFTIGEVIEGAQADASITGTNLNPVLNLTLPNANVPTKVSDLIDDSGHYTKPATGIPATDLSNEVTSSIANKANKVSNATNGNFAALDGNGNLVDSGHKHSDYLTEHQDISGKLDTTLKGVANGLAELDSNGKVPSTQLPSYVDDILEYNDFSSLPQVGETGKIYVVKDTNLTYRWSGSEYVEISASLALGETAATAYRGDRGKVAYEHANAKGAAFTSGLYKITTNSEGHIISATLVQKDDITALGIPGAVPTQISQLENDSGYVLDNDMILVPGTGNNSLKVRDTIIDNVTYSNEANGDYCFVEGTRNQVSGFGSHAEGQQNTVTRGGCHAEGYHNTVSGRMAHAEGAYNTVQAQMSHAEGAYNHIQGNGGAHAEGVYVTASGESAHAEGSHTIARGNTTHAEGAYSIANGACSHAEGYGSIANTYNSHAEGSSGKALGNVTHAEGTYTVAAGHYSHTENNHTFALGQNAHAQNNGESLSLKITGEENATTYYYSGTGDPNVGDYITSHENYARIISVDTTNKQFTVDNSLVYASNEESLYIYRSGAFGDNSHVEGKSTTAMGNEQHVQGKYNAIDSAGTYADIVGNGTAHNARANAYALTWTGDGKYAGDVYVHADSNSANGVKVATINDIPSVPVQDIQVNGTSILSNGVANVPIADANTPGVARADYTLGVGILNNAFSISNASDTEIKTASTTRRPINPAAQHKSVFYGLAKAAGDTTQSQSNNAVGTYTDEAKAAIQAMLDVPSNSDIPSVPVQDVQVNGTSMLDAQGVANVPVASWNRFGVGKADGVNYGVGQASGFFVITPADEASLKEGTHIRKPVTASVEHIATFYGLAKAAGADMASSSNPVGQYTNEAKIAIQKMLGIYEAPWELIREDTVTNDTEADIEITVDGNGQAFELTDLILLFETPKQDTASAKGQYGDISFYAGNDLITQIECGSWTQEANTSSHGITAIVKQEGNMLIASGTSQTTTSNRGSVQWRYGFGFDNTQQGVKYLATRASFTKINIIKVTGTGHYKLYGKRKWQ